MLTVTAFATSHDTPGSMDYRFDCGGASAGILTDTGCVTPEAEAALAGVELLLLESNHDVQWLQSGPYPYPLKRRILGDRGICPTMQRRSLPAAWRTAAPGSLSWCI